MYPRKPLWKVAVGAALVAVLAACSSSGNGTASPASTASTASPASTESSAADCKPVSVAFPTATEAKLVTYAAENGKVGAGDVKLDVHFLEVPALIQATGTDQYDLLQTSLVGFAGAVDKGAPLVAIAPVALRGPGQDKIVVPHDSEIKTISDLKGKTIAVGSIGSTVTTLMRMGLAKESGLDAKTQGGDIKFVEMAPAAAVTGLSRGTVAAAFIYQQAWWKIQADSNFRELIDVQETFSTAYGFKPTISMLITTKKADSAKHSCLMAASDLLAESWQYAKAHPDEVANALTASESVAPEDLKKLIATGYDYGGTQDSQYVDAAQKTLQAAFDAGELTVPVPDLSKFYADK